MIIFNYNYFKSSGVFGYLLIICLVTLCFKGVTLAMPQHLDFVCECFLSTIIPIIRADKPLIKPEASRRRNTNRYPSTNCTALVVWGTNLGSTVNTFISITERAMITAFPYTVCGIIFGLLLSDASLEITTTSINARFSLEMSIHQSAYLVDVFFALSHYCKSYPTLCKHVVSRRHGRTEWSSILYVFVLVPYLFLQYFIVCFMLTVSRLFH